jgi:hypothetical protein
MCREQNRVVVTKPCTQLDGNILGSFFTEEHQLGEVETAAVLSCGQIMKKHRLTARQFAQMEAQVMGKCLTDALFSWPDGPRYDIILYRVARCR